MPKVSINPIWSVTEDGTNVLQPKVLELLSLIYSEGNLAKACKKIILLTDTPGIL